MDLCSLLFINLTAAAIRGMLHFNVDHCPELEGKSTSETIRTKEGKELESPVIADGSGSLQPMYRKVIQLFAGKKHASNGNKYNNITVNLDQTAPGKNVSGMTWAQVFMEEVTC